MSQDVRFADVINTRPEVVFATLTGQDGQEAFYGEPGWFVESACDLRGRRGVDRDVRALTRRGLPPRPPLPGDRPAQSPRRRHD